MKTVSWKRQSTEKWICCKSPEFFVELLEFYWDLVCAGKTCRSSRGSLERCHKESGTLCKGLCIKQITQHAFCSDIIYLDMYMMVVIICLILWHFLLCSIFVAFMNFLWSFKAVLRYCSYKESLVIYLQSELLQLHESCGAHGCCKFMNHGS